MGESALSNKKSRSARISSDAALEAPLLFSSGCSGVCLHVGADASAADGMAVDGLPCTGGVGVYPLC